MNYLHHNDGKEKHQSHEIYLGNIKDPYNPKLDIYSYRGYGENIEEAKKDLLNKLNYFFKEVNALESILYSTDLTETIEVDCLGKQLILKEKK